ncbi:MAG TPA: hypothetical protein VK689_12395, partial [Armatimonadota bacterium]|nr:hypothetical protein [Armatimonadota bacterium]
DPKGPATFMLVTHQGRVLRQVRLASIPERKDWEWSGFTWVGGDRFVVTRSNGRPGGGASAWWVDFGEGTVKPIARFQGPPVGRIAGFPDGGFVVLGTTHFRYTMETTVHCYDAGGRERWKLRADLNSNHPGAHFSPKDLAVTSEGKVGVLDVNRHTVQLFDRRGRYQRTLSLEQAWKRKPNYPSTIVADVDGGFAVEDFQASSPVVWMRADGSVREELRPRFADGRVFPLHQLGVAPDGRLWTCDSHSLLRLDASGRVDQVVDSPPSTDRLGDISAVRVDGGGRIYALSARTQAVHVFDPRGQPLHVCRPGPTELVDALGEAPLAVTSHGHVYLGYHTSGGYLHFGPDGARLGIARAPDDHPGSWHFGDRGSPLWVVGHDEIRLVRAGVPVRRISRRPDTTWLADIDAAAVSPSGKLAVLEGWLSGRVTVSLYSPDGEPVRSFQPSSGYGAPREPAFNGDLLVLGAEQGVVAYDGAGRPLWKFLPAAWPKESFCQPFLLGSTELLLFDGVKTIHRYQLPRS